MEFELNVALGAFKLSASASLQGPVTALFGPSGAGKTTLLRAMAGLVPARGRLVLDGLDLLSLPPERRRVGYVPQNALLFPHLSVRDNIRYAGPVGDLARMLEIEPLLDRRPGELSGGQAQRAALARALASEPRLLLLDEPLAALEFPLREKILTYLRRIKERFAIPTIYVSHQAGEVFALADDVVLLENGRIRGAGPPQDALAMADDFAYENHLRLPVVAGSIRMGDRPLAVSETVEGHEAEVRIRAEEILLAVGEPGRLSARNILPGRVTSLTPVGRRVLVGVDVGASLVSAVTPQAVRDLQLAEGSPVACVIKATSIRVIRP